VVDSGFRANGVGLLGPNRYAILPFSFSDALINFSGMIVVADSGGQFIYSWGTGVATAAPTGVAEFLDIGITQSYVTQPGNWGFSEMNVGGCNAATTAAGSSSAVQGAVNGVGLPILGGPGDCAAGAFSLGARPFGFALVGLRISPRSRNSPFFRVAGSKPLRCRGAMTFRTLH
jgi:hypothetical protein